MSTFNPSSLPDLSGKVYLVTGGNAGIGYETILHLVRKNATIFMGCRSEAKGLSAIKSIQLLVPNANICPLILDHMSLSSVVSAASTLKTLTPKLHGLVNNAGIMAVPLEISQDGYESQWQTNYLAHWVLTHHLLPLILSTARASQPGDVRIVNITSMGHTFAPKNGINFEDTNQTVSGGIWTRYGQSKLANILHAKYLNSLYGPSGTLKAEGEVWFAAVHPGNVYTDLNRNAKFLGPLSGVVVKALNAVGTYIPADQGAYTSVFCAGSQDFKSEMSGEYFVPLGKVAKPSKYARDSKLAEKLAVWTEKEMGEKGCLQESSV